MTASKEMSRPASQHRSMSGANASSLPRNAYTRNHSHSVSLGAANANARISRRKSSSFAPNANAAAIGAAVEHGLVDGSVAVNRRSSVSKAALAALNDDTVPPLPSSLPPHVVDADRPSSTNNAVIDGPSLSAFHAMEKAKPKMRRASEGTRLTKKEKAATGDMKCEHCGKMYKHGSCLNKHLWEHTPQWQYTSKLLISKHQQVQLLEAASVLVAMNQDPKAGPDSDNSPSPAASGSSDTREDEPSSAETTPPPQTEEQKRLSNASSAYSRSYQSIFSSGSAPSGGENGFGHYRQWSASSNNRPTTGHTSIAESYRDEDPADLAAAVGLLSCSYGTPKNGPTTMPSDVPPVPPLPAKYQSASAQAHPVSGSYASYREQDDVDMDDDDGESSDEEHHHHHNQQHEYEGDEGMFGRMDA